MKCPSATAFSAFRPRNGLCLSYMKRARDRQEAPFQSTKSETRNPKSSRKVAKTQREGRILSAFATLRETFRVSNFNFGFRFLLTEGRFCPKSDLYSDGIFTILLYSYQDHID